MDNTPIYVIQNDKFVPLYNSLGLSYASLYYMRTNVVCIIWGGHAHQDAKFMRKNMETLE